MLKERACVCVCGNKVRSIGGSNKVCHRARRNGEERKKRKTGGG